MAEVQVGFLAQPPPCPTVVLKLDQTDVLAEIHPLSLLLPPFLLLAASLSLSLSSSSSPMHFERDCESGSWEMAELQEAFAEVAQHSEFCLMSTRVVIH